MSDDVSSSEGTSNLNEHKNFVSESFLNDEIDLSNDQQYNNEKRSSHLELNSTETKVNANSNEESSSSSNNFILNENNIPKKQIFNHNKSKYSEYKKKLHYYLLK